MSELTDQVVRDLQARLGHGGFSCSLTAKQNRLTGRDTNAEFLCKVPWKECTVRMDVPQKGWVGVRITVYQAELSRNHKAHSHKVPILEWGWEHSMFDPTFNPDHIVENIALAIESIKAFFKAHKDATLDLHGNWQATPQALAVADLKAKVHSILGHLGQAPTS